MALAWTGCWEWLTASYTANLPDASFEGSGVIVGNKGLVMDEPIQCQRSLVDVEFKGGEP